MKETQTGRERAYMTVRNIANDIEKHSESLLQRKARQGTGRIGTFCRKPYLSQVSEL